MKKLFRHFIIDTFSLWTISRITEGLVFENGIRTLIIAGVSVSLVSLLAKPVINLLLLPLNLVTFGVFRWFSSAIVIYLVSMLITEFRVSRFYFAGYHNQWFDIPELSFTGIMAYIAFSFMLSLLMSFIYWLIK
jgi:putative membrane protein